jgi:hypothetical protein
MHLSVLWVRVTSSEIDVSRAADCRLRLCLRVYHLGLGVYQNQCRKVLVINIL